jgi:hypothetical protein
MNVKKTALATAISFALAAGPVWAKTTTVEGEFILDRTIVEAGSVVNLAILGLDKNGVVDLYGERSGAVIIAIVSSDKGEVIGGDETPGEEASQAVAGGDFAASVRYVKLTQGTGRVHIEYPYEVSGTDTVEVILQERVANPTGGVEFNEIARTTKTIEVNGTGTNNPGSLDIVGFERGASDSQGKNHCFLKSTEKQDECQFVDSEVDRDLGIWGVMTAGKAGGQILVQAGNLQAIGQVTVSLRNKNNPTVIEAGKDTRIPLMGDDCKADDGCYEYRYQADMRKGEAVANLDSSITKAGTYYIEATFEGFKGDSVDLFYADTLKVLSTGIPNGLKLYSSKKTITKPHKDYNYASDGQISQGTKIWGVLLDEYGNPTSNGAGGGEIKVSVIDDNAVFDKAALNFTIPANSYSGKTQATGNSDAIIGNAEDEVLKVGTTSLVAVAVEKTTNKPIASIAPSEPLEVKVVTDGLRVEERLTSSQMAGAEFDAFTVYVTDNKGDVKVDAESKPLDPGPVKLTSGSGEQITVNRQNEDPYNVQGLFRKVTSDGTFKVGDAAGNFGEVIVTIPGAVIKPAAATVVELQNAHGIKKTVVNPGPLTDNDTYVTKLPESAFKMFDDFGNAVTGKQPLTESDTGTFTVSSANGRESYAEMPNGQEYGIPGRVYFEPVDAMGNPTSDSKVKSHWLHVTYQTKGPDAYAGEDQIQVNFTKPGLGAKSLTISTNVQAPQVLDSIKVFIEQDTLPVNSEVAMMVEVLDQEDRRFREPNALVTLQINGQSDDTITPKVTEITGSQLVSKTLNFSETGGRKVFAISVGAQEGQFSLTFADASDPQDGTKVTKTFTVQRKVAPAMTADECKTGGDHWNASSESCKELPKPNPGGGSALVKKDGSFGNSNAEIQGGAALGSGDFEQDLPVPISGGASDEFELVGTLIFDDADVGKKIEVVVLIGLEIITESSFDTDPVFWFQMYTDDSGNAAFDLANAAGDLTKVDLAYLKPFQTIDSLSEADKVTSVPIVKGKLAGVETSADPWRIKIYLGYRLPDGSLIYNQSPFGFYTDY